MSLLLLSLLVLSLLSLLLLSHWVFSFDTIWFFEFDHNLSFWVLSQFNFSFVTVLVFEFDHNLSFWVWLQPCMQMDFRQFSRNNMYVSITGNFSEIHLHAWLFVNPCVKVLIVAVISWSPDLRVQLIYSIFKQSAKVTIAIMGTHPEIQCLPYAGLFLQNNFFLNL